MSINVVELEVMKEMLKKGYIWVLFFKEDERPIYAKTLLDMVNMVKSNAYKDFHPISCGYIDSYLLEVGE